MANILFTAGIFLLGLFNGVAGKEYCTDLFWCDDGYYCCEYDTQCCFFFGVGSIVGIGIGVCVFIGINIFICICCKRRRRNMRGMVVLQNPPTSGTRVVSQTTGPVASQIPNTYGQPGHPAQGFPQHLAAYGPNAPIGQPVHAAYGQQTGTHRQPGWETFEESSAPPVYKPN